MPIASVISRNIARPICYAISAETSGDFDPASIVDANGNRLLQQYLFGKTALSGSTVFDESSNRGDARAIQEGYHYLFDNTNDKIVMPADVVLDGDFTVSGWFYRGDVTLRDAFLSKGDTVNFMEFNTASTYLIKFDDATTTGNIAAGTMTNNEWFHFTTRRIGSTITAFRNGVSVGTVSNSKTVTLRDYGSSGAIAFNGGMFDQRIYTTGISDADVASIYNFQAISTQAYVHYKASEDTLTGTSALDSSGNKRHGVITNATLATFRAKQSIYSWNNVVGYTLGKNFFRQSEMFNITPWTLGGITISSTTKTAPDGTLTGDEVTEDATTGNHRFFQATAFVTGSIYTISVYLKYVARRYVGVNLAGSGTTVMHDLQNGVISGSSGVIIASGMEDVGNGWYRCWHTATSVTTGNASSIIYGSTTGTGSGTVSYTGLNGIAFEAWGTQIELGALTSYQKNTVADSPAGTFIPRDESIITQDVLGNPLQFTGRVPYNGLLKQSNCVSLDGVDDYIDFGNVGTVTGYKGWVKLDATNQSLFTLTNNINTQVNVSAGVLSSGASLTLSNIKTNGTATTAAAAGALLNTLAWTYLEVDFTSTSATSLYIGTSGGGSCCNGDFALVQFYNGSSLVVDASCAAGAGTIIYNKTNVSLNGTLINGVTWAKQDVFHANITYGYSRYDHATLADILVPYSSTGIPLVITPPSGYTKISDNPAGGVGANWHNGCETKLDRTGGVASPAAVIGKWSNDYDFNEPDQNPAFHQTITNDGVAYKAQKFIQYETTLAGTNLTKVLKWEATTDVDAVAYIAAVEAALGSALTDTQKYAINNFIAIEKSSDRWTLHKKIFFPVWGNAAANALCIKTLASGSFAGTVTHGSGFVQGNGSTGYFDLGATPQGVGITIGSSSAWQIIYEGQDTFNATMQSAPAGGSVLGFTRGTPNVGWGAGGASSINFASTHPGIHVAAETDASARYGRKITDSVATSMGTQSTLNSLPYATFNMVALCGSNPTRYGYSTAKMGGFGMGLGMSAANADALGFNLRSLYQTVTGLTLP